MLVGAVKETLPGEKRVALVPAVIPNLKKAGFDVIIEQGAGESAGFPDSQYSEKGTTLVSGRHEVIGTADILAFIHGPNCEADIKPDSSLLHRGQVVIGMLDPSNNEGDIRKLAQIGVAAFALELLPRITRAQNMDVLSSMATVAGYKAALLAADSLPKMFPLLMTAAGTVSPAHVFVIGAGVAGLQAIATSRRLGANVQAYDIRPAVKEQVESLGAKFVELPLETSGAEEKSGYARAMDEEFYRKQRALLAQVVAQSNVVISTASVPGKKAPVLITADMVGAMKPGSVIIDLAAAQGGNVELTRPDETVRVNDITIIGPTNLASAIPFDASQMYARNVVNFILYLRDQDGNLRLDSDDEIIRATNVTAGILRAKSPVAGGN